MTISRLQGKIYPDLSFTVGIAPRRKLEQDSRAFHASYFNIPDKETPEYADWLIGATSIQGSFCSVSESPNQDKVVLQQREISEHDKAVLDFMEAEEHNDFSALYDVEPPCPSPLLVKSTKSSQKKRSPYGKHGITRFGRRVVKNASLLLQQRYTKRRLGFGTATLPDVGINTLKKINANLSDVVRRYYQKIRRICEKRGHEFKYVGVTEIQEKRFANSGYPVPHIHFVYVSKAGFSDGYIISTRDAYIAWNDAVNEVLQLHDEEPIMGRNGHIGSVKLEPIRTSASAYIGKYMSKGCNVVNAMIEAGFEEFPKQWWTADNWTKKLYKSSIYRMDANEASFFFYESDNFSEGECFTYLRSVWINVGGHEYRCGMVGAIDRKLYNTLVYKSGVKRWQS